MVYLMGRVTEREANRAAEVARGVSGVAKVVRVFEIISEAELANIAAEGLPRRRPAAGSAAPASLRPRAPARPYAVAAGAQRRRLIRLDVSLRLPPAACMSA